MNSSISRRQFLHTSAAAAAGLVFAPARAPAAVGANAFSFLLLGDLHYDKMEHHDLAWVQQNHPGDISQMRNYSRITREVMPDLFATVRATIADLNQSPQTRVAFVLQVGDVVEGLCGTEELATRQDLEALAFVRGANLGAPFLFAKGNHDVTGEGAVAAFRKVFHPFLTEQARALSPSAGIAAMQSARYTVEYGNTQFAFFDAYDRESLDWFEAVAGRRSKEHFFTVVHPPVVPYGARATWNIFSAEKERKQRDKFLELLGGQRACVLGGHIHKFNTIVRTAGTGRFVQLAVSSVVGAPNVKPRTVLSGLKDYTGDQIRVEPNFSPGTAAERSAVYADERPFVKEFEYADLPGYAVVTVDGPQATAKIFPGTSHQVWRTVDFNRLLAGG